MPHGSYQAEKERFEQEARMSVVFSGLPTREGKGSSYVCNLPVSYLFVRLILVGRQSGRTFQMESGEHNPYVQHNSVGQFDLKALVQFCSIK